MGRVLFEMSLSFGPFRLIQAQKLLLKDEQPVPLGSRARDILIALLERPGQVVSKDDLMARVWPNQFVEEANLKVNVAALRKALGDGRAGQRYIINIPGRGYSFVGTVTLAEPPPEPSPPSEVADASAATLPRRPRVLGRTSTVEHVGDLLLRHRFVTIVGPGGIGKTTVAVAVADRLAGAMPDGVRFVDLAPLDDPLLVPSALASVLGIAIRSGSPMPSVLAVLKDKRMLIVLDNCEHVIEAAAFLAEDFAKGVPGSLILATSREPLLCAGERVYRLPPLETPDETAVLTAAEALRFPAVQLFVERAAACLDGFTLEDSEAPVVAEACRRLDGLALAIELTASRIDAFGVAGLASLLDDRFRLPRGQRTALPRHQTLGATLDWSHALLSAPERVALRRASVFAGAFTMQSARAVLAGADLPVATVDHLVANLVSKSLVTAMLDRPIPHYRLLDTTRAYARHKLVEAGEAQALAQRHAAHILTALQAAEADWAKQPAATWIRQHRGLIDDVRMALEWAFGPSGEAATGVALTIAALPLWFQMAFIAECCERVERALAGPPASRGPEADMRLHAALAWSLMQTRGSVAQTRDTWTHVLSLAEQLGNVDYQLRALWGIWAGKLNRSDLRPALALAERFYGLAEKRSDPSDRYVGDRMIGYIRHLLGDQDGARYHIERMLAHYKTPVIGAEIIRYVFDQRVTARCFLARILWLQGFADQAARLVTDIVDTAIASNDTLSLCQVLVQAACPVAVFLGRVDQLQVYVTMLLHHAAKNALEFWETWGRCFNGLLLIKSGETAIGVDELRRALDELKIIEYGVYYVTFLGEFAEALGQSGALDQAMLVIEDGLQRCESNEELWTIAELYRIKGDLLVMRGSRNAALLAERAFETSLTWARRHATPAWELRTSLSLYRLWSGTGRANIARARLAAVFERFTEGFETADLIAAAALLQA